MIQLGLKERGWRAILYPSLQLEDAPADLSFSLGYSKFRWKGDLIDNSGKPETKSERLVYTKRMLRNKPVRSATRDVRDFPTYTIPEVGQFLGIPARTLREWFSGENRILDPSGKVGELPLLSFNDAVEAYAVFLMRSVHQLSMASVRNTLAALPRLTKAKNPILSENLKIFQREALFEKPARGASARRILTISKHEKHHQHVLPDVADVWANRVENKAGQTVAIFPWRYWNRDQVSKPVEIDPNVMSGRLVITGTRIPVSFVAGRHRAGESIADIANDYRLPYDSVAKALRHLDPKAA